MNDPKNSPAAALYAAFYPRVSKTGKRTRADLERHTLAEQRDLATGFLPRKYELIERPEYEDVNVSGRHSDRPGLEAVFEAVESGEVQAVVVGYLSRFGRNVSELLANIERLHAADATLYVARDGLVIAPGYKGAAKLLLVVLGAVDEMQAENLAESLGRSNGKALANGVSIQVPYGYRRSDGPGSPLMFDKDGEHMPAGWTPYTVVVAIYGWRLEGLTVPEIVARLTDAEIPTPSHLDYLRGLREEPGAQSWRTQSVENLIATHTYRGVIPRGVAFTGEGKRRRATAWEYLPAAHPAIVEDEDWHDAQVTREAAVRNGISANTLLQGIVRCSNCSQTMTASPCNGGARYKCRGSRADCDHPSSISMQAIDAYVLAQVLEGRWDVAEHDTPDARAALEHARAEHGRLVDELDRYVGNADVMDKGDFQRGYTTRRARVDEALSAVAAARRAVKRSRRERVRGIEDLPVGAQNAGLREVLDAVVVTRAPGRGRVGVLDERVTLIGRGLAPFPLSGTGRAVAPRPWPLEAD